MLVPLKNETVKYKCKIFNDTEFELKIFNIPEGLRFSKLARKSGISDGENDEEIYQDLIDLGVVSVNGVPVSESETVVPWFVYVDLVNELTRINTMDFENIKK